MTENELLFARQMAQHLCLGQMEVAGGGRVERTVMRLLSQGLPAIPAESRKTYEVGMARCFAERRFLIEKMEEVLAVPPQQDDEVQNAIDNAAMGVMLQMARNAGVAREHAAPLLAAGYFNTQASYPSRSACLRAMCGLAWLDDDRGPAKHLKAAMPGRSVLDFLDRELRECKGRHENLVAAVLEGCTEDRLLQLLRPSSPGWEFSPDHTFCKWGEESFDFTGTQAEIMRELERAWEKGEDFLSGDDIFERVNGEPPEATRYGAPWVQRNFRIQRKGERVQHPAWEKFVVRPKRGFFALRAPERISETR